MYDGVNASSELVRLACLARDLRRFEPLTKLLLTCVHYHPDNRPMATELLADRVVISYCFLLDVDLPFSASCPKSEIEQWPEFKQARTGKCNYR